MASAHSSGSEPSIADLFRSVVDDTRRLVRDEVDLARTEIGEKAHLALQEALLILAGVVLAAAGGVGLLGAVAMGLAHALTPLVGRDAALWLSPLLMGASACIAGVIMLRRGVMRLRSGELVPQRTIDAVRDTGRVIGDRFKP